MDIDMNKEHWANEGCPKYDCRKAACKCGLRFVDIPAALGDDSKGSNVAPKNGEYCNAIVRYEANGRVYIYSKEGVPVFAGSDTESLEKMIKKEILDRQDADNVLQQEIDDLKNSPDVVDIVATYAALQAYDTSKLGDNDIVRVLEDETHDDNSTYYRWDKQAETWTYVGEIDLSSAIFFYANPAETGDTRHIYKDGAFTEAATIQDVLDAVAKGQVILRKITNSSAPRRLRYEDAYLARVNIADPTIPNPRCWLYFLGYDSYHDYLGNSLSDSSFTYTEHEFQGKLTAGTNITIDANNEISATDTTYSNFTGTDGIDPGTAGLVPAPATTDAGKFLKADGTWDTAGGGGPTVVQTTGTSQTDVMSQNAVTSMVFADPSTRTRVQIGSGSSVGSNRNVAIGQNATASNTNTLAVGSYAWTNAATATAVGDGTIAGGVGGTAIGYLASTGTNAYSVALGERSATSRNGEVNVGTSQYSHGYNSTNYRVIGGVHDGVDAHDAATVGQVIGTTESYTIATTDWSALSSSSPYDYQTTVTATYTIGNDTILELINDNPVAFANNGFAIGSVSTQSVTIYSIGQPSASVTLKVNYKG